MTSEVNYIAVVGMLLQGGQRTFAGPFWSFGNPAEQRSGDAWVCSPTLQNKSFEGDNKDIVASGEGRGKKRAKQVAAMKLIPKII